MRGIYKTYEWSGKKDPICYIAKTCVQLYAIDNELTMAAAIKEVAAVVRCHPRTLHNWFTGPTISPRFELLTAVINATGEKVIVADEICDGTYKLRNITVPKAHRKAA